MSSQFENTDNAAKMQPVRLNDVAAVNHLRDLLQALHTPLLVEFCARGTRFTLGFIPSRQWVQLGHPDTGGPGYIYIGLFSTGKIGGFYPFDFVGYFSAGYLMEKLHITNEVDAVNIAALLNALGCPEGPEYYLTQRVRLAPGRDYVDDTDHNTQEV